MTHVGTLQKMTDDHQGVSGATKHILFEECFDKQSNSSCKADKKQELLNLAEL